jgi:undecaprenyl phosphate-alpha-L-ara4FN deformylase
LGVPNLCRLFAEHHIATTFFFSVGPDNMGRHLWRLLHPSFLKKMLRSKASKLYGWDIIFKGTFFPGPVIGEKLGHIIRAAVDAGHEIGFHAWDHHEWQARIDSMSSDEIRCSMFNGVEMLFRILGYAPSCSASPAWKCNDLVLIEKNEFSFVYNSDCRGNSIFYPLVNGQPLSQPQIPVTLPTYDEVIGENSISDDNYNEYILSLIKPDKLNVLTIHAEVEGIACFEMFEKFVRMAQDRGISLVPLKTFLSDSSQFGQSVMIKKEMPGREGWMALQA